MVLKMPQSNVQPLHRLARKTLVAISASVVALIAILSILIISSARQAANRSTCEGQIRQIGLALLNYHSFFGEFPPAYVPDDSGSPMHSWRVLILPFLGMENEYEQYTFS